ncbi:MAG: hypothetical protein JHC41_09015 [Nitrosopumilus sp.]|nr:hypothetical protein [Nitrosopumilus sp.]
MNTHNDLRKKRIQLERKVHSIILSEGNSWRETKVEERQVKQKFLKAWTEYTKNQNSSGFLHIAEDLAQVLKKERIENQKLERKYLPYLNELKKIEKKLA